VDIFLDRGYHDDRCKPIFFKVKIRQQNLGGETVLYYGSYSSLYLAVSVGRRAFGGLSLQWKVIILPTLFLANCIIA